jgi:hypothetical protein
MFKYIFLAMIINTALKKDVRNVAGPAKGVMETAFLGSYTSLSSHLQRSSYV